MLPLKRAECSEPQSFFESSPRRFVRLQIHFPPKTLNQHKAGSSQSPLGMIHL